MLGTIEWRPPWDWYWDRYVDYYTLFPSSHSLQLPYPSCPYSSLLCYAVAAFDKRIRRTSLIQTTANLITQRRINLNPRMTIRYAPPSSLLFAFSSTLSIRSGTRTRTITRRVMVLGIPGERSYRIHAHPEDTNISCLSAPMNNYPPPNQSQYAPVSVLLSLIVRLLTCCACTASRTSSSRLYTP